MLLKQRAKRKQKILYRVKIGSYLNIYYLVFHLYKISIILMNYKLELYLKFSQ